MRSSCRSSSPSAKSTTSSSPRCRRCLTRCGSRPRSPSAARRSNAPIYIGMQAALSILIAILGLARLGGNEIVVQVQLALSKVDDVLFPSLPPLLNAVWIPPPLALGCAAFERPDLHRHAGRTLDLDRDPRPRTPRRK